MNAALEAVRDAWGWVGLDPDTVVAANAFGHLVVRDGRGACWYLDPEMATCERVADGEEGLAAFRADPEVEELWRASALVEAARAAVGDVPEGSCYSWKMPPALGGAFEAANVCVARLVEVIRFSGNLGEQIRDLPDGAEVRLEVIR